MFFKKKNDNNIDNNDKNAINIENVENNNNNNKKEKRKFKDSINKKYLKNGSYSSVMIVVFVAKFPFIIESGVIFIQLRNRVL